MRIENILLKITLADDYCFVCPELKLSCVQLSVDIMSAKLLAITMLWAGYFVLIFEMVMPVDLVGLSISFIAKSTAVLIKSLTFLFL